MDDESVRKIVINDGEVAKFSDGTFVNRSFLFRHPVFGGIVTQSLGIPSTETFKWAFKYGFTDQEVQRRLKHSDAVGFDTEIHERGSTCADAGCGTERALPPRVRISHKTTSLASGVHPANFRSRL